MEIKKEHFTTLWYQNENGDVHVPDLTGDMHPDIPKGFNYQHSRFPCTLQENINRSVVAEEVAECDHPAKTIKATGGWIDGIEGRECQLCKGTQVKKIEDEWPDEWEASGSRNIMTGNSGWSEELAGAMFKSGDYSLSEAIIISGCACERCMNVLGNKYGLTWGYEELSQDWKKCGTICQFCEDMGYQRVPTSGAAVEAPPILDSDPSMEGQVPDPE